MSTPDVETMVAGYLRAGGYGGLYNQDGCGCSLDDLVPCGEINGECQAAWRVPCFRTYDEAGEPVGCHNYACDGPADAAHPEKTMCSTVVQP